MRALADENFPRPALESLRQAGWDVASVAETRPGSPDVEVARECAREGRVLLTFDKDFGEMVFRKGLPAGSGIVLFRDAPESPEDAAALALRLAAVQPDLRDTFCVVRRDRIRVRRLRGRYGT